MNQIVTRQDILDQAKAAAGSQATSIEQSRAMAEVYAGVTVAQRVPRDITESLNRALETCRTPEMADRAFFKFPRGGTTVSGPSIHLAVEMARCWGNIIYGISELDRDDDNARSEMLAYAWDLQTNTSARMTFIVPHKRDKRGGPEVLTDLRDIYENNANMGARRLRECIFRVLPPNLIERAKQECMKTLQDGGDRPLSERLADMVRAFQDLGISRERLEAKAGCAVDKMTAMDYGQMRVSYASIKRGEISAEEEFPPIQAQQVEEDLKAATATPDTPAAPEPSDAGDPAGGDDPPPSEPDPPAGDAPSDEGADLKPEPDATFPGDLPEGQSVALAAKPDLFKQPQTSRDQVVMIVDKISGAVSLDVLNGLVEQSDIKRQIAGMLPNDRESVENLIANRRAELAEPC